MNAALASRRMEVAPEAALQYAERSTRRGQGWREPRRLSGRRCGLRRGRGVKVLSAFE
jgi:hypothetical protein